MSVKTVLYLALQWSNDESYENVQDHPETLNISRDAINQWFHKFRHIVVTELDRIHRQETIEGNEAQEQFEGAKIKKIKLIKGNKSDIRRILSNNSDASWAKHYFKKRKLTAPHYYYHLKDCQWKRMIKSQNKHVFIEFLKLCAREFPPKLNDFMAKNIPIDLPE
ncbi:glycosyl-phosphatidylinositol-linked carbonic anhydrase [Sarcoptes scabiei]|nr:glycosyl-phosphatidylinositol-linked carbonic anhydrase [Sarcoptes scabiei]